MDLKMPFWCLLCALFLCNSKHRCPWSYSSSFKQLCAVYSPHNLWKLKYQSLLIPTTSKCKNQAVCLLFREAAGKKLNCAHTGAYWVVTQENRIICSQRCKQHLRLTGNEDCAFSLGCNTSRFSAAMDELVLHEKWMPYIQKADIGRLMRSVILCLWRVSSTQHGPRGNHVLHRFLRLHLLLSPDKPA